MAELNHINFCNELLEFIKYAYGKNYNVTSTDEDNWVGELNYPSKLIEVRGDNLYAYVLLKEDSIILEVMKKDSKRVWHEYSHKFNSLSLTLLLTVASDFSKSMQEVELYL